MKKVGILCLSFILAFVIFSSILVSAQVDLERGAEQITGWIQDMFGPFLEAIFGSSEYLFEKLLFFVLVLSFAYVSLNKSGVFGDNPTIIWIICIVASLLATRFLTEVQFVKSILLSYTVLGVALTSIIPLIIYFFFVESFESSILRRILWAVFIAVFIGLWIARYNQIGNLAWIYVLTGLLALIFLVADGTVRRALVRQQMKQLGYERRSDFEREIKRQMRQAEEDLTHNIISRSEYNHIMRRLKRKLKAIRKL